MAVVEVSRYRGSEDDRLGDGDVEIRSNVQSSLYYRLPSLESEYNKRRYCALNEVAVAEHSSLQRPLRHPNDQPPVVLWRHAATWRAACMTLVELSR